MVNLKENYNNIESFISENGMGVENENASSKMVKSMMYIESTL